MKLPHRKNYPKELYFRGYTYKVKFTKKLPRKDCIGLCDPSTETIYIYAGLGKKAMFETFVHEVIHMVEFTAPMRISHEAINKLDAAIVELLLENL